MNLLVSAIIPTHHRPELVRRAVRSALSQTHTDLEVIVVIDGPEPGTAQMLEAFQEPRLRVLELEKNVGLSGARNAGAQAAKGEWIALLDDDDEWLPERVEMQLALVFEDKTSVNLVGCRVRFAELFRDRALPSRFPRPGEDMGEFVYCHRNFLYPSTFLIRKQLLLARPFCESLHVNEDCDWLLHGVAAGILKAAWHEDSLVIIHDDMARPHHHEKRDDSNWKLGYEWAIANRGVLLTRKAFSYCLLRLSVLPVRRSGHPFRNAFHLLCVATREGSIDAHFLALFAFYVCFSNETRRKMRVLLEQMQRFWTIVLQAQSISAKSCTH